MVLTWTYSRQPLQVVVQASRFHLHIVDKSSWGGYLPMGGHFSPQSRASTCLVLPQHVVQA